MFRFYHGMGEECSLPRSRAGACTRKNHRADEQIQSSGLQIIQILQFRASRQHIPRGAPLEHSHKAWSRRTLISAEPFHKSAASNVRSFVIF
jgi:hypothetical protein